MENAKTYIVCKLKEVANILPEIKILYKYDSYTKEHLIKVTSKDIFESDEFKENEVNIITEFIDKYPDESLIFFSSDDWIDIDIPDEIINSISCSLDFEKLFSSFKEINFETNHLLQNIGDDYLSDFEVINFFSNEQIDVLESENEFIVEDSFYYKDLCDYILDDSAVENKKKKELKSIEKHDSCSSGENNFALAA